MTTSQPLGPLRGTLLVVLVVSAFAVMFLMFFKALPAPSCHPQPAHWALQSKHSLLAPATPTGDLSPPGPGDANKSLVLVWFWPDGQRFPLSDCKRLFNIDNCRLTDDRTQYPSARGVLFHHRAIADDLANIPSTRPRFQRWIWLNMDPPSRARRILGLESLFNLTLSYRKDSDIHVRWKVSARRPSDPPFRFPPKKHLVCWALDLDELGNSTTESYVFFTELSKHIQVKLFHKSSEELQGEGFFSAVATCKFYLSLEDSVHTDYITEVFTGPLAAGTVPVAFGPPRSNYEKFVPGSSFIHAKDFGDAASLATFLQRLDADTDAYMRFFDWWKFYMLRRPFSDKRYAYALPICQACRYVGLNKDYRVVKNLDRWFWE